MKLTPKEYAIYKAGYQKGYARAKARYSHSTLANDPDARLEQDKAILTDFLTEQDTPTPPEQAALALGWRVRRTRRAYRALGIDA